MSFKRSPSQLEKCNPLDTNTTLSRFCCLIQDEEGRKLIPRQLLLLSNFFSVTKDSVMIADLELIARVLRFLSSNLDDEPSYKDPILKFLCLLKNIPKLSKSSDSLYYFNNLTCYFSTLGNLLHILSDSSLQLELLDILHKLLNRLQPVGLDNVKLTTCIRSVELSFLAESLADLLVVAEPQIVQPLLNIILRICILSEYVCWGMLVSGMHETLLIRLTPSTVLKVNVISPETLDLTLQILWKLLSCTHKSEDWQHIKPLSQATLTCVRSVLQQEVLSKTKPGISRDSRNNFAGILVQFLFLFPNTDLETSGLVEDIVILAVTGENGIEGSWSSTVVFTSNDDDFQFKNLMLAALTLCPKSILTLKVMEKYCVTESLIKLLNPGMSSMTSLAWSSGQIWHLLERALDVISNLFPFLHKSFLKNNLLMRLLVLLEMFCNESYLTLDIVFNLVRTIHSICLIGNKHLCIKQELRQSNAITVFFRMCEKLSSTFTMLSQTILTYCLSILVALLCDQAKLLEQFGNMGMNLVVSLLQHILKHTRDDFLLDNKLILAVGNFMWEVIVWHKPNAINFIKCGHMYYILDILEMCETVSAVKHVYLSLLVDLCTYVECVPYLVTWRCVQKSENLLIMLCKFWREEETRLGVKRSKEGCLTDIEQPLMGKDQHRLSKHNDCLSFKSSPAILDVIGSIRPKINAVVQILCHHNKDITSLAEEQYHLGHSKLSRENQVTLQIIEAYLPLKLGEIWAEYEQRSRDITPLNRYIVSTLVTRFRHWAIHVKTAQYSILRENNLELNEEEEYYTLLKSCHLTSALEALREVMFIARTSSRQFLLQAKEKQRQEIKSSNVETTDEIQRTYPHDINITTLSAGRKILLKYR